MLAVRSDLAGCKSIRLLVASPSRRNNEDRSILFTASHHKGQPYTRKQHPTSRIQTLSLSSTPTIITITNMNKGTNTQAQEPTPSTPITNPTTCSASLTSLTNQTDPHKPPRRTARHRPSGTLILPRLAELRVLLLALSLVRDGGEELVRWVVALDRRGDGVWGGQGRGGSLQRN